MPRVSEALSMDEQVVLRAIVEEFESQSNGGLEYISLRDLSDAVLDGRFDLEKLAQKIVDALDAREMMDCDDARGVG